MDAKAAEILEQPEKIQNCQIKTVGRKQLQTPFLFNGYYCNSNFHLELKAITIKGFQF